MSHRHAIGGHPVSHDDDSSDDDSSSDDDRIGVQSPLGYTARNASDHNDNCKDNPDHYFFNSLFTSYDNIVLKMKLFGCFGLKRSFFIKTEIKNRFMTRHEFI